MAETAMDSPHRHWYSRDYLPHFDRPRLVQAITFRLHDSMPAVLLERWGSELQVLSPSAQEVERRKRIAAHGSCWLRDAPIAEIVEVALLHFHGVRYRLLAWVIMPNHVHALVEMWESWPLPKIVQSWKIWTAKQANKLLARSGSFWARDFHDRYIRDGEHFENARRYVEQNPVKAGFCKEAGDWRWSSAWTGRGM